MKALFCLALVVGCGLLAGCGSGSSAPSGQSMQFGPPGVYPGGTPLSLPTPPQELTNYPQFRVEPVFPAPYAEAAPLAPAPIYIP